MINLILALPTIELTEEMWQLLSTVINSREIKSFAQFKLAWSEYKIVQENTDLYNNIMLFMEQYFNICLAIQKFTQSLSHLYQAEFKKSLGSDELLPLIINLLPKDDSQLELLIKKSDDLLKIMNSSILGFCLTTLYIAFMQKKIELPKDTENHNDQVDHIVLHIQERQVKELFDACMDYKNKITHDLIVYLKKYEATFYYEIAKELMNTKIDDHTIAEKILQKNNIDEITFSHVPTEILRLNFFIITDLILSLKSTQSASKILETFFEKHVLYHKIIIKGIDLLNYNKHYWLSNFFYASTDDPSFTLLKDPHCYLHHTQTPHTLDTTKTLSF